MAFPEGTPFFLSLRLCLSYAIDAPNTDHLIGAGLDVFGAARRAEQNLGLDAPFHPLSRLVLEGALRWRHDVVSLSLFVSHNGC